MKEFLKFKATKIVLTFVLIVFVYLLNPTSTCSLGNCPIIFYFTSLFPLILRSILRVLLNSVNPSFNSSIYIFIVGISWLLIIIGQMLWSYLVSCTIIYIYNKNKEK